MMTQIANVIRNRERAVFSLSERDCVMSAAQGMSRLGVGSVLLLRDRGLVGIFTRRDLLRRVVSVRLDPDRTALGEVMTSNPATVSTATSVETALAMMHERGVRHLPVMRGGEVLDVVSSGDIARALSAQLERELDDVYEYVAGPHVRRASQRPSA